MAIPDCKVLNQLDEAAAKEALAKCCGARRWVERMAALRPFASIDALNEAADRIWWELEPADWLEAFTHHPKIGDRESLRQKFASTAAWASNEQSGTTAASEDVLAALAEGNQAYDRKFGHIFIVCATGKSAQEMLDILQSRLPNDPATELRIAAEEQRKITRLRLEKLIRS